MSEIQKFDEEFESMGKNGFEAVVSSYGQVNKSLQAIAAECTAYSKEAFDEGTRAWELLLGAKSFEQAFEVQSQYVMKAYNNYIAECSKLGEMCTHLTPQLQSKKSL